MVTNHPVRSFLENNRGSSSDIKVSNLNSRELPSAFASDGFGFVLLKAGQKHPPIEKNWQNKPHGLQKAMRWVGQGNNLGILVKYPYAVLDLDNPDAVSGLSLPDTTAWQTRPGRIAYLIRWSEDHAEISKILKRLGKNSNVAQLKLSKNGAHVGELKLQRTYQVIPPSWKSIDGKRVDYKMVQDVPPATVSFRWLISELQRLGISFSENQTAKDRLDSNIKRIESIKGEGARLAAEAEKCLQLAIEHGRDGARNDVGFELARALRDLGIDAGTASEYMIRYHRAVENRGDHSYTRDEALRSLESAYSHLPEDKIDKKMAMKDFLIKKVLEMVELWHDSTDTGYISIPLTTAGTANYPIKSTAVRHWLSQLFFEEFNKTPRKEDISSMVDLLEALAAGREVHEPHLRIAEYNNKIYIDLGRADWKILEIDSGGWRLVDSAPVKFIRHGRMKEIPEPKRGGSWQNVIELLRLHGESSTLILGWLLQAVWPHGPYVHLVLDGEQGTGKSTLSMLLKLITDPSEHLLRRPPRDEEDLFVAARKERILSFDNISGIHDWLSDALCCFSTGATYSKRQKYTDWEEAAISIRRPCILNGIEALPARPDLLDRTIIISLKPIAGERLSEAELVAAVEEYLPEVWGLLADAASAGLRNRDRAKEELRGRLPRMADFAIWITACEEAMPWEEGEFLRLYTENKLHGTDTLLEGDILAMAVIELARQEAIHERCFEGTPSLLYNELMAVARINQNYPPRAWPANASWMMRRLKRLAPALRNHSVEIDLDARTQNSRIVRICLKPVEEVEKINDSRRQCDGNDGNTKMPSCNNRYAAAANDGMTAMTPFSPESPSKEEKHRGDGGAKGGEVENGGENAVIGVMASCDGDACRKSHDGKVHHDVMDEKCRHCVDELREKIRKDLERGSRLKDLFTISTNVGGIASEVLRCLEELEAEGVVERVPDAFGNARWRLKV